MLEALLRRKLRQQDAEEALLSEDDVIGREDPLTAAVFTRLSYLPVSVAWSLIGAAVQSTSGVMWSSEPPAGEPLWRFWPRLRPSPEGNNVHKVEPDVLLAWGRQAVLFEMKHRGVQWAGQWREQVLAARHAGYESVTMVAVGGRHPMDTVHHFEGLKAPLFTMSWTALRAEVVRRMESHPPHERRVLRDLERALQHWGYRPSKTFETLPTDATPLQRIRERILSGWDPMSQRGESVANTDFSTLIQHAALHRPNHTRALAAWRVR